jgi:membrane-associated protease RseP (regulator of RpoE activity)
MGVEAIRGRPLPLRVREYALGVGMALIAALMIFVILHDIARVIAG